MSEKRILFCYQGTKSVIQLKFIDTPDDISTEAIKAIEVKILSICDRFWSYCDGWHRVKELAEYFGMTPAGVREIAKLCEVQLVVPCSNCDEVLFVTVGTRTELERRHEYYFRSDPFVCQGCKCALETIEQAAKHDECEEVRTKSGVEAYDKALYQSLSPIELRVLTELAATESTAAAFKKVGISQTHGDGIYRKLKVWNLICECPCHGYSFPIGAKEKLLTLKESIQLKPILNPMEAEIFRRLKAAHAFIFPHQLLRVFIPEHIARNVLTEFPSIPFSSYLMMEVDFLICDENYRPIRAVEYQGGYHSDDDLTQVRDTFKKAICAAVGVPLKAFEKSSLWKDDELQRKALVST